METMPSETTLATEAVAVKPDDAAVEAAPRATAAAEVVTRPPARARLMVWMSALLGFLRERLPR